MVKRQHTRGLSTESLTRISCSILGRPAGCDIVNIDIGGEELVEGQHTCGLSIPRRSSRIEIALSQSLATQLRSLLVRASPPDLRRSRACSKTSLTVAQPWALNVSTLWLSFLQKSPEAPSKNDVKSSSLTFSTRELLAWMF